MTRTLRYLFLLLFIGISGEALAQAGELFGTVLDATKQPAIGAIINVESGGISKGGTAADIDGNYSIKPLQPGRYTVKVQYAGHNPITVSDVLISPDNATKLNFSMETSKGNVLKEVQVKYVRPLVDNARPGTNNTMTREQIKNMPTRNTADIASLSTGVYQQKQGQTNLNIGGGRSNGTLYMIDGVMVSGGANSVNLPPDAIDQMEVITSGIPAKYGDASGGVIKLTTRGISKNFRGGVNVEHSLDGYNNNYVAFNISGPFMSRMVNDIKKPIVGFFLSGDYRSYKDNDPSYGGNYVVNDAKLADMREHPLVAVGTATGVPNLRPATEFVTMSDLTTQKAKVNASGNRATLLGKLDYEITPGTNLTVGGSFNYTNYYDYNRALTLFAPDAMQKSNQYTGRGYIRFTQRFGKSATGDKKENNKISNAYYTVQADYQKDYISTEDPNNKRNPFLYGYVGKFVENQTPVYSPGLDTATQVDHNAILLQGYQGTGITYTPSNVNPYLSNYTSQYYALGGTNPTALNNIPSNGAYLRNGDNPGYTYSLWPGVGYPQTGYGYSRADQFSFGVDASFDYKHNKTTHAIEFGLYYQQRTERDYQYGVRGRSVWTIMRQLTSANVNNNLDHSNPIYIVNGQQYTKDQIDAGDVIPGPGDTVTYNRAYNGDPTHVGGFDYNLRQKLGASNHDYIQPDAMDPSTFSMNMFTPDELLNSGKPLVSYYGYDYLGNVVNGQVNFNDFFTAKDANGNYTRTIGAYRPNYMAGYISDAVRFKDILFTIGVRIERFDNNTKVLKDPYSTSPTYSLSQIMSNNNDPENHSQANFGTNGIPSNIGSGYVVYVDDNASVKPTVTGYRNGDTWYDATGREVADPNILKQESGRDLQPYLQRNTDGTAIPKISDAGYDPTGAFTDYKPQVNVMPRISFSFPINDVGLIYAHYDVIMQRPKSFSSVLTGTQAYASPVDYMYIQQNGSSVIIGNNNLKPERLTNYEVGFQQKLSDLSAITLNAFYKERRDQIQARPYLYAYPTTYYTYANKDFSSTKGLGVKYELRRVNHISMLLSYTLQFAEGTGSTATSSYGNGTAGLQQNLIQASLPNLMLVNPLDYDSRHNIAASIDYRYAAGEGPEIGGLKVFQNAGINLMFNARSGEPYTHYAEAQSLAVDASNSRTIQGGINGNRLPWHYMFNLKIDKDFALSFNNKKDEASATKRKYYVNAYVMINNLLNTRDVLQVYPYTGRSDDDGYLTSPQGIQFTSNQTNPKSYSDLYTALMRNPSYLNNPRRIILGLSFNF
ncbi:carboxypeptidase regulatory-like domain-containing protein [Taibaiella soli]|nr:carboxypeptidase regulatory-like domain-containing protein [Taibaiella soli]